MSNLDNPWEAAGYDAKSVYKSMMIDGSLSFCWHCESTRKPFNYYGPWMIERAHICNKPRREDRRLVIGLCTICHKVQHGERLSGFNVPRLQVEGMLFIKQKIDPDWFDLEFLQRHSVRVLPEPAPVQCVENKVWSSLSLGWVKKCL